MTQFHFEPATYLAEVRREIPAFDELQGEVARAAAIAGVERVLDLGSGTGETARAVLRRHPAASLWLLDESAEMLAIARGQLPADRVEEVVVGDMRGPIPRGPFDLVVSALAVHHLASAEKHALFERLRDRLRPAGRFVLGDVVIPADAADAVTPLSPGYDQPDRAEDLVTWLGACSFAVSITWSCRDLIVIAADRMAP